MKTIAWFLEALVLFANVWMTLLLAYHLYLSLFGFKRAGARAYAAQDPKARFLILVPAHNEEAVIADMVRSLASLDYPQSLYDTYIIADNCTDQTADIARALGANVIETHKENQNAPTGKPIALRKALDALPDYAGRYDLLMIFDADNLMDANILSEVNSQYISEGEPEIIQCYLGSKNREGLVALFYHVNYTITNRFMNLSKYRLGLNASAGGTGFAIRTSYVKARGGWTAMSLTEDFEMQVDVTLSGGRILWNHVARIYDEKPTNIVASFRQRLRWAQGHWFVALRNTPRLVTAWLGGKISFAEAISIFTYMYSMVGPVMVFSFLLSFLLQAIRPLLYGSAINAAINAAKMGIKAGNTGTEFWRYALLAAPTMLIVLYSLVLLYWWSEKLDNNRAFRLRQLPFILLSDLVNLVNVSLAQTVGFFRHRLQNKWVKTAHKIKRHKSVGAS
ncbi:MAG: glycosyltransferase family 2 protein [Firmicutes bacterium]|nr:glycosyltransferase family 2 protein [Bacillota bacterium]